MNEDSLIAAILERLFYYSPAIAVAVVCVVILAECIKELNKLKKKKIDKGNY